MHSYNLISMLQKIIIKKKNIYLLINNAESTGTHPDFNTGLVYLLYKTHNIHNGKIIKYTAIMIQDIQ